MVCTSMTMSERSASIRNMYNLGDKLCLKMITKRHTFYLKRYTSKAQETTCSVTSMISDMYDTNIQRN